MEFTDKVCVVTGGARGIGRRIVERFAAAGADVAFVDPDKAAGRELAKRLGPTTLFVEGDVALEETQRAFAARVVERFGRVHCLVNNACVSRKGILSGCGHAGFSYVLALGVTAPYMLTRLFLEHFAADAAVVNIASTRAFMSQADTESYSAAKGGICALTHALAISLAGRVRVNAVSPGWIETAEFQKPPLSASVPNPANTPHPASLPASASGAAPAGVPLPANSPHPAPEHSAADRLQHPAGRVGGPEDIAAMVLFLCGPETGFITGQNFVVDGGMTRRMIYHGDEGWSFTPRDKA